MLSNLKDEVPTLEWGLRFKSNISFGVMPKVTVIAGSSPAVSTNRYN